MLFLRPGVIFEPADYRTPFAIFGAGPWSDLALILITLSCVIFKRRPVNR
jgi:hypothetical protein